MTRLVSALAVLVVFIGVASAAPKKRTPRIFAFREFTIDGDVAEGEGRQLRDRAYGALEAVLASQGDMLVPQEEVRKVTLARPKLKDCSSWRCNAELGDALRASRLMTVRVEQDPKEKSSWRVRLVLFNVDSMTVAGTRVTTCDNCTFTELSKKDLVSSTVNELLLAGDNSPSLCTLKIDSEPKQAIVLVDGEELGNTPFKRTIEARKHIIAIAEKGYANGEIVIECAPEKTQEVFFTLTPNETKATTSVTTPPTTTESPSIRHPLMLGLGISGVVVGAPLLAVGSAFVAYDGKGTCTLEAGERRCERRAATLGSGVGLTVAGGVLAAAGVGLLIADALIKPRKPNRVSVVPLLAPTSLGLSVGGSL